MRTIISTLPQWKFNCDAPGCKNQGTGYGDEETVLPPSPGWITVKVEHEGEKHYCPEHAQHPVWREPHAVGEMFRVTVAVLKNGEWVTLSDFPLRATYPPYVAASDLPDDVRGRDA